MKKNDTADYPATRLQKIYTTWLCLLLALHESISCCLDQRKLSRQAGMYLHDLDVARYHSIAENRIWIKISNCTSKRLTFPRNFLAKSSGIKFAVNFWLNGNHKVYLFFRLSFLFQQRWRGERETDVIHLRSSSGRKLSPETPKACHISTKMLYV